jgi:hypothetical protein
LEDRVKLLLEGFLVESELLIAHVKIVNFALHLGGERVELALDLQMELVDPLLLVYLSGIVNLLFFTKWGDAA